MASANDNQRNQSAIIRLKIQSPTISPTVTARPTIKFHRQRLCLRLVEFSTEISWAEKPAWEMAASTAEMFFLAPEFQRTLARSAATLTLTL